MGYTHYWSDQDDLALREAWPQMVTDAGLIVALLADKGVRLAGPAGTGSPQVTSAGIRLNGDDTLGQAYEPFTIEAPTGTGIWRWRFCKTGQRPYDVAVCAILLRCHLLLPGSFQIDSDGSWDGDWRPARKVIASLFGPAPAESPFRPTI